MALVSLNAFQAITQRPKERNFLRVFLLVPKFEKCQKIFVNQNVVLEDLIPSLPPDAPQHNIAT